MKVWYTLRALSQLASMLRNLSGLGKRTDEAAIRVLIEPNYRYRVFYRLEPEHIVVLSILHRSQK